jgi:hypothetical protein
MESAFGALQLGEGMNTNAAFREAGSTFCGLLKIRKSHRDVKPIENVLGLRRNLLMNGPQSRIAAG